MDRTEAINKKIKLIMDKEYEMIHEAKRLLQGPRTKDKLICLNSLYDDYKRLMTQKEFCEYCLMFDVIEEDVQL